MNTRFRFVAGLLASAALPFLAQADSRRFTYTYEPETQLAGALEFENWVSLGSQRNAAVGQDNYNQWDLRQELEFGVTDRYTIGLYLNEQSQSYKDPVTGANQSSFDWEGISFENRYNLINPADHAVGLTLYVEGRYSGEEAEIEEKIILGQRHADWKWALNLGQATEWEDNLSKREGELAASFGLARDLGKHWSIGLECVADAIMPGYQQFENAAFFVGPVISYRQERWWAALTVLPQVYGWNRDFAQDMNAHFELADHEKYNIRLLIGIDL